MNSLFKKMFTIGAITLAVLGAPKKSEAAIGVISLIGGPAGVPIIVAGATIAVGGSAAVLGTCYIGQKLADWSEDCPIFINFTFWPGAFLLNADSAEGNQIAADIISKYGADQASADSIADRIYNKALRSTKKISQNEKFEAGEALIVQAEISFTAEELIELSSSEFIASKGFEELVRDYK